MEKVLVAKDRNGANENTQEMPSTEDTSGACLCFMCRRPVTGKVQPTVDMLSTVVSKVTVREKVEHETGCQLSAIQRLPTGVCSDCYNIVNEIDVLEHKLNLYRSFLRSNVQASMTNFKKDEIVKEGKEEKIDTKFPRNCSPVASTSEDSSVDNLIAVDDGNYDSISVSLNDVFSKNSVEHHPHSKISSVSLVNQEMSSSVSFPSLPLQLSPIPLTSKADTASVSKLISPSACSIQFSVAGTPHSNVCQSDNNTLSQSSYINSLDSQEKPCNLSVDASNNSSNLLSSANLNEIPVCMIQHKTFNGSEHQGCSTDSVSSISFCQLESLEHCPPSQVIKESHRKPKKSNFKNWNTSKASVSGIDAEMYQFPGSNIDFGTQSLSNITPSILSSSSSERYLSNTGVNIATTALTSSSECAAVSTPQKMCGVPCSGETPKKSSFSTSSFSHRISRSDAGVNSAPSNSTVVVNGMNNTFAASISSATSCNVPTDAHRTSSSTCSSAASSSQSSSAGQVSLKVHSPVNPSKTGTSNLDAPSCVDHEDQTISSVDIMDISHSLSHIRSCCESSTRICPSNFVFNSPNDDSLDASMNNSFLSANCPISISLLSPSFPSAPTYSSLLSPESQVVSCTSPSFLLSLHSSSLDANLFSYANDRTIVSKPKESQVVETVHKTSPVNCADKSDGYLMHCSTSSVNELYDLPLMFPKTKESSPKQSRDQRKAKFEKSTEKQFNPNQECSLNQRMPCSVSNKFSILCSEMEENINKHSGKVDMQTLPNNKLSEDCLDGKRTKRCVNEPQVSDTLSETNSLSFSNSQKPTENYVKCTKKHGPGVPDTPYLTNGKISDVRNENPFPSNEYRHDSFPVSTAAIDKIKMSELPSEMVAGSSKAAVSCPGVTLQADPLLHAKSPSNSLILFDTDQGLKTTEGFSTQTEITNSLSFESEALINALKNGAPSLLLNSERCEGVISSFIHGSPSVACRPNQSNITSHASSHSSTLSPVKTLQCSSHPAVKVSTSSFLDNYQDSLKSDHIHSQLSGNFDGALPITSIFNSKPSFRSNELLRVPEDGSNVKFSDALMAKISFPLCSPTYSHFTTGIIASTVTSSSDCLPSTQTDLITSQRQFPSPTSRSSSFCSHGNGSSRQSSVSVTQDSTIASNLPSSSSKTVQSHTVARAMKTRSSTKLEKGVISYALDSSKNIDKHCSGATITISKTKSMQIRSAGQTAESVKSSSNSNSIEHLALNPNHLQSLEKPSEIDREAHLESSSCSAEDGSLKRVTVTGKRVRYPKANRRKSKRKIKLIQNKKDEAPSAVTSKTDNYTPSSVPSIEGSTSSYESTIKNVQPFVPSEVPSECKATKMVKSSHLDAASFSTCKKALFRECSDSSAGKELSKSLESCEGMELIFSSVPFDYTNSNVPLVAEENCSARLPFFDSKKNGTEKILPKNDINSSLSTLKSDVGGVQATMVGNEQWENVSLSDDKTCSSGAVSKGSQILVPNSKCQSGKNGLAQESENSSGVESNLTRNVTVNATKEGATLFNTAQNITKSNTEECKESSNNAQGNFDSTRSSIITSSHRNVSSGLMQNETLNMSTEFFEHIVASSSDAPHFSIDGQCIPVDGHGIVPDGCARSSFTVTAELINHSMGSHPTSTVKNCPPTTFSNALSIPATNASNPRQSSNFAQTIEVSSGVATHTNSTFASHSNVSMTCKQSASNVLNNVDSFSALHFPSASRAIQGQGSQETRISNVAVTADNKMNSVNMQRYFYSDVNSSGQDTSSSLRLHSELDNSGSTSTKSVLTQCNFPQNNGQVCHSNQVLAGVGRQMMPVNKVRSSNMMSESNCSNNQNQAMFGQVIEQNNFDSRRSNNALNRSNVSVLSAVQVHSSAVGRSESTMDKKLPGFVGDVPQNGSALLQFENYKHERPYCQKNDVQLQASLGNHLIHGNGVNSDVHTVQQHHFQNNCTYPAYQEMIHPCNQVPINNSNFVNYANSNSAVQNYGRNQVNDMRNFPNAYNPHVHVAQHSSGISVATQQQMMGCTPNTYFQPSNVGSRCGPLKINPNQMGCGPQTTLNTQHAPINNSIHDLPLLEEDQTMLLSSFTSQSNLSHLSASVYAVSNQNVSTNVETAIQCKNSNRSVQEESVRDHAVKSVSNVPLSVSSSLEHAVEMPTHHCMSTYDSNSVSRQSAHTSKMRGNVLQNDSPNCQVLCNPEITNHAVPPLPYALNTPNVGMHSHPVQIHANNIYGDNAQQNHNVMPEQQLHYIQQHNLGYCANSFCEVPSVHTGMPYQYSDYHRNKHNLHSHTMSEYVGPICDVSGQHMFQDTLHNTYAASLVPQGASNNYSNTEIYPAVKKCDSPTESEGRNVSVCTESVKLSARKQKCLVSEDVASCSSDSTSKTESCKKPSDKTDMSESASCIINRGTDATRSPSSKLIRDRDSVQLENVQAMAVTCLSEQVKNNVPQPDCILSVDAKSLFSGVESSKSINHTTYELSQVLLGSEKIEDSSLRRDMYSELNSAKDQSSPVDVDTASHASLDKTECGKSSEESKNYQASNSLESSLINYTNPYSVVSSVKTATEMDIDIEECDCSDDHLLLDSGPSDHSDIPTTTVFDGGTTSSAVPYSEEHDLLNLKVSKDEVIQDIQEPSQTATHNSEDSNPVDDPPNKLLDRPSTPDLLRNVQEATEYHKPTLLTRNFKMKKHAKLQICRQCDQVFSTRHCLVRHIERRHKIDVTHFNCPHCEKKCNTEKSLARHMLQHKTFSCKLCQEVFSSRKNFKKHIEQHSRESLTCQHCSKSCSTFQALIAHMASHKRKKVVISCNVCNKEFANKRNLIVHQLTHTGERPHSCSNCHKSFSVRSNMMAHEERCLDKCRFKCEICSRGFPLESVYKRHIAEHEGKFAYSCNVCQKGFSKPSGLKAHMNTHDNLAKTSTSAVPQRLTKQGANKTKTLSTICPVCSKRLARYQLLKDHLARHANQRNYECPDCSQVFFYKSNIRFHQRAQHLNIKQHVCPECSKCFSSKNQLKNHLAVHTGAKPHHCKICGKAFSVHSNYVRHLKCHNNASITAKTA